VLENRYLKVVLLPNSAGAFFPSSTSRPATNNFIAPKRRALWMGGDIFYYDWLMVLWRHLPTLPDAEHGKTWPKPWIQSREAERRRVTVAMSLTTKFRVFGGAAKFRMGRRHRSDLLCDAESRPRRSRCARWC